MRYNGGAEFGVEGEVVTYVGYITYPSYQCEVISKDYLDDRYQDISINFINTDA